jgi:hypothetical protein
VSREAGHIQALASSSEGPQNRTPRTYGSTTSQPASGSRVGRVILPDAHPVPGVELERRPCTLIEENLLGTKRPWGASNSRMLAAPKAER